MSEILSDIDNILENCGLIGIDETTIKQALYIKDYYRYSYYDSLIITSSLESGCSIVYSEDLQHGQIIENSLRIVNPFIA
jgi:predicted nucleic acid-binding protein